MQLRPTPSARDIAYRNCDSLLLPNQHDQPLATGDAGVKQIALQHGVVLLTTGMTTAGCSERWLLWMLAAYAGTSASSSPKPYVTERPSILP